MTEWDPPIETGLNGDAYLSEQAEAFCDSLIKFNGPGVYALKCSKPSNTETIEERWDAEFDVAPPDFIWSAWDSAAVVYVGAGKNVMERITEHLERPNRSSALCVAFPIHSLFDVWFFDSAERAFERESGIALQLQSDYPELYVHQR